MFGVFHWLLEREVGVAVPDMSNVGGDSRSDKEVVTEPERSSNAAKIDVPST